MVVGSIPTGGSLAQRHREFRSVKHSQRPEPSLELRLVNSFQAAIRAAALGSWQYCRGAEGGIEPAMVGPGGVCRTVSRGHTVPVCPRWPQLTAFCKQHNRCLQSACCSRGFHIWVGPGPCLPTTSPVLRACHKASHWRKVCSHARAFPRAPGPMILRGRSLWTSCASCSCSPTGSPCSRSHSAQEQQS